jgi:hypothetical protein
MIGSLLYLTAIWSDIQFVLCMCATFKLPHAPHIRQSFSESSNISNTHSNLGFGISLIHRLILLAFSMLTLRVVGLT